ncbi:MAG: mannitol dehydrogenase family protein, partial [Bacteroidales bacterium]|nr:mannitol dehydrogenase family protein [Bacteroidales bacterium]
MHIGTGNFYRGHEAYYTDEILSRNNPDWGICGVGILEADSRMYNVLKSQDGLYSMIVRESDGVLTTRIIGSLVENRLGPEDPLATIEKMADPEVRIISLTITEGGYNFDANTRSFIMSAPDVQWDLHHADHPKTVFGYLTQAFKRRRDKGLPGITLLSCDNIQHNGDTCRRMLMAFLKEAEPGLIRWTDDQVTFPNGMVDRITPATTQADIDLLKDQYQIEDAWPVVCEPFIQWVIEDEFSNGRPPWESAGVRFVSDVGPYEKMKIRLLNAGHSLLGLLGSLMEYGNIYEAVMDPQLENILRKFMDDEVTPLLGEMEGIDLKMYKESLIQRFANPYLKDQLSRICSDSSAKIPKFLLPTITEQLAKGGTIMIGTLIVAAWCHYSERAGTQGYTYEIEDGMWDMLRQGAIDSASGDPLAFVRIDTIFGNLAHSDRFVETYIPLINSLRDNGIEFVIRQV